TLTSNSTLGGDTRGTEFGNIRMTTKALFLRGNVLNMSGGLAVSIPTAQDIAIRTADGNEIIRVENTAVQLTPFVAVLFTPNTRFFAQVWYAIGFNTGGDAVRLNPGFFNGVRDLGNLNAASVMTADLQLGYWLYQGNSGLVRGVAPFFELHYNGDIGKG